MSRVRTTKLITQQRETIIRYLLAQDFPELQKRGLQQLCNAVERGQHPYHQPAIVGQLQRLRFSPSVKVRRWLYKSIALLHISDAESREYLTYQISTAEKDPENVSWASSALFAIAPEPYARSITTRAARFNETHLELSAQLFNGTSYAPSDGQQMLLLNLEDNELTAKWYCLLFGYDRADSRITKLRYPSSELVQAFTRHHVPEVSEYAIWGLFRNPKFSCAKAPFDTAAVPKLPANVRRWVYRFLGKTKPSFQANIEVFRTAIRIEEDEQAKEGLALALCRHFDSASAGEIVAWFTCESSLVVRVALLEHISRFANRCGLYEETLLRMVRGDDVESRMSPTLVISLASESGAKKVRQAAEEASKKVFPIGTQITFTGDFVMSKEQRTIVNRTESGIIKVESINQGQSYTQSAKISNTNSTMPPEVIGLLESYVKGIQKSSEIDELKKEIARSAVNDIHTAASDEKPESKRLTVSKAILALEGLAAAVPKATEFVHNTKELIQTVRSNFGI